MDEAREEREELAALEREAEEELREYDPVGSGYALDDPKHPDAARWS